MPTSKLHILVVEDNEVMRKEILMLLTSLDCYVDFANSGEEAVSCFKRKDYDLIFIDIGLPGINGLIVTKEIRKLEQGKLSCTPLIILTSHSEQSYRQAALESGANAFFTKPLKISTAKAIFNKYLS